MSEAPRAPSSVIERLLSIMVGGAAVLIAVSLARIAFFPNRETGAGGQIVQGSVPQPIFHDDWGDWLRAGWTTGSTDAPAKLVVFSDLQCPACRHYEFNVIDVVRERFGDRLAVSFVHFPLARHDHAFEAGVAMECAGEQGKFAEFIRAVYEDQSSLGQVEWWWFAERAGVPDPIRFTECRRSPSARLAVEAGRAIGESLRLVGTPAVALNGWLYSSPPPLESLLDRVELILSGSDLAAESR